MRFRGVVSDIRLCGVLAGGSGQARDGGIAGREAHHCHAVSATRGPATDFVHRPDGGAKALCVAAAGAWNAAPSSKVPCKPVWAVREMVPRPQQLSCIDSNQSAAVYRSPRCRMKNCCDVAVPNFLTPTVGVSKGQNVWGHFDDIVLIL